MDIKVLSWNVEHFNGKGTGSRADRVDRVAAAIQAENPDVFALMEVEGATVFTQFTAMFPNYVFSLTEGRNSQEIMVAVRGGLSAFVTQRTEFKRSNPFLRPGALLTLTGDNADLPLSILFAHFKSGPTPEGFGLRDAMYSKARNLKKAIDNAVQDTGASAQGGRFMLVGDLNTMGMNLTFSPKDMDGPEEIKRLDKVLRARKMVRLRYSAPFTFNDGSQSTFEPALLDHVYASSNLEFKEIRPGADVRVAGWAELTSVAAQDQWIDAFSDHAPLIFVAKDI